MADFAAKLVTYLQLPPPKALNIYNKVKCSLSSLICFSRTQVFSFFERGFAKSCSDSSAISCPDGRIMPVIRCFSMVMFCKRGLRGPALQEALFLAAGKKPCPRISCLDRAVLFCFIKTGRSSGKECCLLFFISSDERLR